MITADADPAFMDYQPPFCRGSGMSAGGPPCRNNRDQQWVTLGTRLQTGTGFTVAAAVDVATHSAGFPYGPPLAPWNVVLGVAYPLDLATPKLVTRTVTVERRGPPARRAPPGGGAGQGGKPPGGAPLGGGTR